MTAPGYEIRRATIPPAVTDALAAHAPLRAGVYFRYLDDDA